MSALRVQSFSISIDGYGAGPDQDLQHPLGHGGEQLHTWAFTTRTFRKMFGQEGGATGEDDALAVEGFEGIGSWILGRNMFAHSRGPWRDDGWKGWWGDVPPYHCDVYVLTHHQRDPLPMAGGTTFYFVTGGIHEALERARASAQGKDVRLGGGVATIREYLTAGLEDRMHLAISPVMLGAGENLFTGIDLPSLGFRVTRQVATAHAMHVVLQK